MKDTIHIVSYSDTPVAGVPVILARCIAARTAHNSVCVWRRNSYGNGVSFKGGVEWSRDERNASELLEQADLFIVHNGKVAPQHRRIISAKPVITLAHNYRWNVDSSYVDAGNPGAVVGQYQAALPEFAGWHVVPNPIPLWEPDYQPAPKPDRIAICYTPSAKHEQFPEDHKLYWHSKGYRTTMEVLEQLAKRHSIQLETIRRDQVDLVESLAMKRRSHIVIDECVTGSYHRNSLEGLAAGCVVINGMHLRPKVQEVFRHCAGEPKEATLPFEFADLRSLEDRLTDLIQRGSQTLTEMGRSNRQWMEAHWDFATQWSRFWLPLIELANKHSSKTKPRSQSGAAQQFDPGQSRDPLVPAKSVSVIIPHGGDDRLPLLIHTVRMLREVPEVGEIIIVEFGPRPTVMESAASNSGIFHIFIRDDDQFHKARAMNAGLSIASKDLILWLDNDLIMPPAFLRRAAAELEKRELHCLIPWRTVQFLSENETQSILEGRTAYSAATPVASYSTASGCRGGAILVRREFAFSCGGIRVEFHGWGGEDDAWFHFASRMGRAAVTELADQTLYHLYHRLSGGYGGDEHVKTNPRYGRNVALLRKLQTLQAKDQILENFPVAPNFQSPWPASVILRFVLASVDSKLCAIFAALGRKFRETFGVEFEEIALHKLLQSPGPLIGPCVFVVFGADELEANWHEKIPGLGAARVILVDLPPGKRVEGPPMPIDALVTSDTATIKRLAGTSIATYFFPQPNEQSGTIMGLFQILVQAVSMEAPIALEAQEEKANQRLRLNIGLAISPRRGFTNVDCGPASAAPSDVIIDLRRKWPWPDNSVRQIEARDFLEHLPDKNFTMNEMWRVMKHDAEATISLYTTDGPGAWQDPLHVSFWNRGSFLYYEEGSSYRERFAQRFGIEARFSITQAKVEQTEHGPLLTVVLKAIKQ